MEPRQIADVFVEALRNALATMARLDLEVEAIGEAPQTAIEADLAATIGLSGANRGILLITLSASLAPRIAAAMLDADPSEVGLDDAIDTVAELANMTAGEAKRAFAKGGHAFNLAPPTRIVGAKPAVMPPTGVAGTLVRGRVYGEPIQLAIWLEKGD